MAMLNKKRKEWKMRGRVFFALILAMCLSVAGYSLYEKEQNQHDEERSEDVYYSYDEHGPDAANVCERGMMQSPVQITRKDALQNQSPEIEIHYGEGRFEIIKKAHTAEAVSKSGQNYILIDHQQYKLESFHFHLPSEHQVEGQSYEMELHFVHENKNGEQAVMAVFIQEGQANEMVKEIWSRLQDGFSKKDNVSIRLPEFIPKERRAFYYTGSLTTPPCTEGVKWIVFEMPVEFSEEQIGTFHRLFGNNSRQVQPLNGRKIYQLTVR